jgi:hypothetical protein
MRFSQKNVETGFIFAIPACFKPGAGIQGVYRNATFQPQQV